MLGTMTILGKRPALVSWSSGKDSALALHRVLESEEWEVVALLTTITESFHRVSMHGVREALLEAQAERLGLPLEKIFIPYPCSNEVYESKMTATLNRYQAKGVSDVIFGDLFLADLRAYREQRLREVGMRGVFPLWQEDTKHLANEVIERGIGAILTCVDPKKLNSSFAGRLFDEKLLKDLPKEVDPCGENGEFHTFVFDAPLFRKSIAYEKGEVVTRDGFVFADMRPTASST